MYCAVSSFLIFFLLTSGDCPHFLKDEKIIDLEKLITCALALLSGRAGVKRITGGDIFHSFISLHFSDKFPSYAESERKKERGRDRNKEGGMKRMRGWKMKENGRGEG